MFTGLVEEIGIVRQVRRGELAAELEIGARRVLAGLSPGDSMAVNGVCLTVTARGPEAFLAEVMAETLGRTNLADLEAGARVNLERALPLGGRLGGHLVSGHVDDTGLVVARSRQGPSLLLAIRAPAALLPYLVPKGSVAVDGVSLTVVARQGEVFTVSLVRHTLEQTTLGEKAEGARVNLEVDLLARYLAGLLAAREEEKRRPGLSKEFLVEHGFI